MHSHHVAYVVLHVLFGPLKITHLLEILSLRHIADKIDTQFNMARLLVEVDLDRSIGADIFKFNFFIQSSLGGVFLLCRYHA